MTEKSQKNPAEKARQRRETAALRPYLVSLLSLLLCIAMFAGTTFAWMTEEVTSSKTVITVGTVRADLRMDGVSLRDNSGVKIFTGGEAWEPGREISKTVTVKNEGELKFFYQLSFTAEGAPASENIAALFQVYSEKACGWIAFRDALAADCVLVDGTLERDAARVIPLRIKAPDDPAVLDSLAGQRLDFSIILYAGQEPT